MVIALYGVNMVAKTYTVIVTNGKDTWNELATDMGPFNHHGDVFIALKNPLGDDSIINPEIHTIKKAENGIVNNGNNWFHPEGPTTPPTHKDALPKDEMHNHRAFK
jgi:hypothetical protein